LKHKYRVRLDPIPVSEDQLLYSRKQVAKLLGRMSLDTIRALEAEGHLIRVRLTGKPTSQVFCRREEVEALARGMSMSRRKRVRLQISRDQLVEELERAVEDRNRALPAHSDASGHLFRRHPATHSGRDMFIVLTASSVGDDPDGHPYPDRGLLRKLL
jgi:uncharacterized Fe-S cluster-containing radical SAM superfamily enzyme